MKNLTPGNLAFWVALIFTFILSGFFFLVDSDLLPAIWYVYAIASAVVFALSYFIIRYIISIFLFHKIRPIYRIIRKSKDPDRDISEALREIDPLKPIYSEVNDWLLDKNMQIDQLKANEKYRKDFLGDVSHELKTPIFNIQGYILTLLGGGHEDPNIIRPYLEKAEKNINRMIQVVNDLEYISKIESGSLGLEYEKFDMVKLVDEVFEYHRHMSEGREINLKFKERPEKPVFVMADRKKIMEVLGNLVVNGIIYGKQGGFVMIDFIDMYRQVLVEVSDNGLGIQEEHQSRIFERFYRIDRSRSREQGGSGLGLAIVKHLIEAHGQSINLRSAKGEGSSFTFTLNKPEKDEKY